MLNLPDWSPHLFQGATKVIENLSKRDDLSAKEKEILALAHQVSAVEMRYKAEMHEQTAADMKLLAEAEATSAEQPSDKPSIEKETEARLRLLYLSSGKPQAGRVTADGLTILPDLIRKDLGKHTTLTWVRLQPGVFGCVDFSAVGEYAPPIRFSPTQMEKAVLGIEFNPAGFLAASRRSSVEDAEQDLANSQAAQKLFWDRMAEEAYRQLHARICQNHNSHEWPVSLKVEASALLADHMLNADLLETMKRLEILDQHFIDTINGYRKTSQAWMLFRRLAQVALDDAQMASPSASVAGDLSQHKELGDALRAAEKGFSEEVIAAEDAAWKDEQ